MKPVSSRFLAALRGSHTSRYRVRVLTTFQTGTDPSGTEVDIVTGSVTLDGTANERASLDLTLDSQAGQQWPANQFGALAPFGNELFIERGIEGLVQPPTIGSLPAGVIVGWPSTAGSIPAGWTRVTELDGRYLKGIPNNSTNPGTTGGSADHTHTPSGHSHGMGTHTHSSGTVPASGSTVMVRNSGDLVVRSTSHTHSGTSPASTNNTSNQSPPVDAADNDPVHEEVIWIRSDGTTNGIPNGAVAWFDQTSLPSGWTQHTTGNARYLKGAAPAGNGGGTGGSNTHTHTSPSHTHTTTHSHPTSTSSAGNIGTTTTAGNIQIASNEHTHQIVWSSASPGDSGPGSLAFSTDANEPPFYTLALGENTSGDELGTVGMIAVWLGSLNSIPTGWVLCDGNNGTPNLMGRYVKNATAPATEVGNTGGALTHTHTGVDHSHSVPSHTHSRTYSNNSTSTGATGDPPTAPRPAHPHNHGTASSGSASGTTANAAPDAPAENHEPPHVEVAFIQLQSPLPDPITPDAEPEYVPLGYFRIETIEQEDAPRSPIRVTARDRMAAIIEARMLEPRTFAAGTTFLEVFENLVLEVYPSAVLDIDNEVASSTLREPATVEEDRYAFLRDMATSRGRVMFFDHRGVLVVAPEPDSTTPVFTVNEGQDGVLINLRRQLSRAGVYNAVVAEGTEADYDNEEPPARAVVVDDNPDSATYFFGPFGQVPRFYSSPFIFTDAQAQSAAASILSRTTGIPYTLDITAIPNPALEPLDPIRVIFEAGREEIHVIDTITIPLTSDQPMAISSRSLVQFIAGQEGN